MELYNDRTVILLTGMDKSGKMALGTAVILLLLETTEFIPGVRWLLYESAYNNRTVKVTVRWPPKSHINSRAFLLAMSVPVSNIVQCLQHT